MAIVIESDRDFDTQVLNADELVLVDFFATWCWPCRMVSPIVEELGVEYEGRLKTIKLDIDKAQATAQQYEIQSIPTLQFFYKGEAIGQPLVWVFHKGIYQQAVENALEHVGK